MFIDSMLLSLKSFMSLLFVGCTYSSTRNLVSFKGSLLNHIITLFSSFPSTLHRKHPQFIVFLPKLVKSSVFFHHLMHHDKTTTTFPTRNDRDPYVSHLIKLLIVTNRMSLPHLRNIVGIGMWHTFDI